MIAVELLLLPTTIFHDDSMSLSQRRRDAPTRPVCAFLGFLALGLFLHAGERTKFRYNRGKILLYTFLSLTSSIQHADH